MKRLLTVLLTFVLVFGLTACGDETKTPKIDYSAKKEITDYIGDYINSNFSSDVSKTISKITVSSSDEKEITVRIRTVLSGGFYIPQVAKEAWSLATAAASEKNYTLVKVTIEEYSESNENGIDKSTLIHWHTDDGENGTLVDGREKDNMPSSCTVEELFDYFKAP